MKTKGLTILMIALFLISFAIPSVYATDYSNYGPAHPSWYVLTNVSRKVTSIKGETERLVLDRSTVENVGTIPLNQAVFVVKISWVILYDGTEVTNPEQISELVSLKNSGETWPRTEGGLQGAYILKLGTIQPGQTTTFVSNWQIGADVFGFGGGFVIFYLP